MPEKTPMAPVPTVKHHFITAGISAGIVLVVLFLFWFTFKVIPSVFSNGSNFVATSLSATFIPGEATTTATAPVTTQTNSGTQTTTARPTYTAPSYNYYGRPDLAVQLIATGIIDPATKQFVQTSYAGQNDEVAIKLVVRNIGTNVSGPWTLRLNMPSRTTPYYDSGYQTSIKPGDRIEFVASFDNAIAQGVNTAYITADPLNLIPESNESNNSLTVPMQIQGTTYSYNNNYNYGATVYNSVPYGTLYTWSSMSVNCYANPQTTYPGNMTTWYATASGGNGYYTYSWSGSDNLFGDQSVVNKTYYTSGLKTATVTVTSNNQSVTKVCNMMVY